MTQKPRLALSRRAALCVLGAALAAPAIARAEIPGARRLKVFHARTGERFEDVYYADGIYMPDAMEQLDNVLRDHRADEATMMDVRLYDLFARLQARLETNEAIRVTSGYRTPATNEALRRRTRWAAKNSLHIQGMAADFTLSGKSGRTLAKAAQSLSMGGVGTYRGAQFIHVDVGAVRKWTR